MNHTPLNYALWLLGRRDRSIGEIKEKLILKEYSLEEVKKTIDFLCKNNFLNDERFAKNFIRNQLLIKPLGEYQLRMRLRRKFIQEDIIEKILNESELDEKKQVNIAFSRWIRVNKNKEKKYEKVSRHLIGRGFSWDIIKTVLEEHKSKLTTINYKLFRRGKNGE